MFSRDHYIKRRDSLKNSLKSGLVILLGNRDVPQNYSANTYAYRQDSNFIYFLGIDHPGFSAVLDIDNNEETLYGDDFGIDDVIWMGEQKSVQEIAADTGVQNTASYRELRTVIQKARDNNRKIHFLPVYRGETIIEMADLLGMPNSEVNSQVSMDLIKAVIKLRSYKDEEELTQLKGAMEIAEEIHLTAMKMAREGITEQEIAGAIQGVSRAKGCFPSFNPIVSVRGEVLHNLYYHNTLAKGQLLLTDAGAESNTHYASDITRTVPVEGKFSKQQQEIYEIVLAANCDAISRIKPNVVYRDIHLASARIIVEGLKNLGIMKGNTDDAVSEGAHALFFPHGLGHMLGLDVHDMEGLGEDNVGYNDTIKRSDQFGLAALRLGRALEERFVVTVEPGLYFIPLLIEQWKKEPKWDSFINFKKLEMYKNFGGIRIEDDILVTSTGHQDLSESIPKTVADLEKVMSGN